MHKLGSASIRRASIWAFGLVSVFVFYLSVAVAPASAVTTFPVTYSGLSGISEGHSAVNVSACAFPTGGGLTGWTATVDWGDGTGTSPATVDPFTLNPLCPMQVVSDQFHQWPAGVWTVTVTVTSADGQFVGTGTGTVTVAAVPSDLGISIGAEPNPSKINKNLTYSITVVNHSDSVASEIQVVSTLPPGVQFVSYSSTQGTCLTPVVGQTGVMTCSLGRIAAQGSVTITVVAKVILLPGATLSHTATVTALDEDPNPGNNSATVETSIGGGGGGKKK
jgi:uncharacterized repeat protein (TIGR01451 family)